MRAAAARALAVLFLALVAAQAACAALWCVRNFAKVPHDGDTREMLVTARTLEFVEGRTVGYPWLLRGMHALFPDQPFGEDAWWEDPAPGKAPLACGSPRWSGWVQVGQTLLLLGAFALALRRVPRDGARGLALLAAAAACASDPWILAHGYALLTDGPALAALLVAAAGASAFLRGGSAAWLAVFALAHVAAAALRWEKSLVLVCTGAGVVAGALLLARRAAPERRALVRRAWALLGAAVLAHVAAGGLNGLRRVQAELLSPRAYWLHQRVVAGHLADAYDRLSPETRAVLSFDEARRYDAGVALQRVVLERTVRGDRELLERLTDDMVGAVWPREAGAIALDGAWDALQYLTATAGFYARLAVWWGIEDQEQGLLRAAPWEAIATRWAFLGHEPGISLALERVGLAATLAALAGGVGLLVTRGQRRERGAWRAPSALAAWLPAGALLLANSCAFALSSDLFALRYALPSHAALLALLYGATVPAALRAVRGG